MLRGVSQSRLWIKQLGKGVASMSVDRKMADPDATTPNQGEGRVSGMNSFVSSASSAGNKVDPRDDLRTTMEIDRQKRNKMMISEDRKLLHRSMGTIVRGGWMALVVMASQKIMEFPHQNAIEHQMQGS